MLMLFVQSVVTRITAKQSTILAVFLYLLRVVAEYQWHNAAILVDYAIVHSIFVTMKA